MIDLQFINDFFCCRGRIRTSTGQLAIAQSSVVDPGRFPIAKKTALCCVYPVSPPPRQEGMSAKFHHSTIFPVVRAESRHKFKT